MLRLTRLVIYLPTDLHFAVQMTRLVGRILLALSWIFLGMTLAIRFRVSPTPLLTTSRSVFMLTQQFDFCCRHPTNRFELLLF